MIRTNGISDAEHDHSGLVEAPCRLRLPYPNAAVGLADCAIHDPQSEVVPDFSHY